MWWLERPLCGFPNVRMSIQQTSHESKEGFGHTLSFTRSTICHPFKKSTSLKNEKRSEGWWREHITAISLSRQFIWRNCATKSELPKAPWAVFVFHCLKTPFLGSFVKLHSRFCFSLFKKKLFLGASQRSIPETTNLSLTSLFCCWDKHFVFDKCVTLN